MGFAGGIGLDRVRRQLFVQLQGGQLDRSPGLRHCSEPQSPRPRLCRWGAGLLLASCWGPGFSELDPALGGVREQDQFRLVSQRTAGLVERYGPRARLLNLSDRMEVAMGRIPSDPLPWGDADDLEKRLAVSPLPLELWLASSGPPQAMERKLKPLQSQVLQAGYHCEQRANDLSHARLLRCRSEAMGRSE